MNDTNFVSFDEPMNNLDTFSIVWLDEEVNKTDDNLRTQRRIRKVHKNLIIFDDDKQCYQYISSLSPQHRLLLIVSGRSGQQLVPRIHHLPQISTIYIYCQEKKEHKLWAERFNKIKRVIDRCDDLIYEIQSDVRARLKTKQHLSLETYNNNRILDQATTKLNGHFVHSLLLTDTIIRIKTENSNKKELISFCKQKHSNSKNQLALIDEFEQNYSSNNVLWWYTRETFLSKMLNEALRTQDIYSLYLFHFVIADIYKQLQQNQCQSPVTVYRASLMWKYELERLQQSTNELVSINSFFSTTRHRKTAKFNLGDRNPPSGEQRVLFTIDADPRLVTSKPFADISSQSCFPNESEVLFMAESIFRLKKIRYDHKKQIWKIRMTLWRDDQHDLNKLFSYMKREYGCGEEEVSLQTFGDVLFRMGKDDIAEKFYYRLYAQLSNNDPAICDLYYAFGLLSKNRNEYDISLEWFRKALEIKWRRNPDDYIYIGTVYGCIGNVHLKKGNDVEAMECYRIAIDYCERVQVENYPHKAAWYHGIGDVYLYQKQYQKAFNYYKNSLYIEERDLPRDHPDIATSFDSIGNVYWQCNEYDRALDYYKRALAIRLRSLPPGHSDIAMSYKNIGLVHEMKNKSNNTWKNYQKEASMYRQSTLPVRNPDVIEIEEDINNVFFKMGV